MKLTRCPVCHEHISLTQLVQDECGRELLGKLSNLDTLSGSALVMYLTLFRSGKRDLANDRALRLTRELEQLADGDWARLAVAMSSTVEQMRAKGNAKAFSNHNYLKQVLADVPNDVGHKVAVLPQTNMPAVPASKTDQRQAYLAGKKR